ncbi:MAG: hypothetical protein WBG19_07270 [Thermoplasmata archaeon]
MPPTPSGRPVCEVQRAYRDLIGRAPAETHGGANPCSPEAPELRSFPVAPTGGAEYTLCNGHLRDLFDELSRLPSHSAPVVPA